MSQTAPANSAIAFTAEATAQTAPTYQWKKDGVDLAGETGVTLNLASIQSSDAGFYTVVASDGTTSLTSRPVQLLVTTPTQGHLINMSVRTVAGVGSGPLIVGFNVAGGEKDVLVRVAGPVLSLFGLTGVMEDPVMAVHADLGAGDVILQTNDNWGDGNQAATLSALFASVGAFGWSDTASLDSALLATMSGNRTIHVNSTVSGQSGIVLVEAYDAGSGIARKLTNVSARNYAGSGSETLIVGFVIDGSAPKQMLIRAVGPTLDAFGVTGFLADPRLELHRSYKDAGGKDVDLIVAVNDNWEEELGATSAEFSGNYGAFGLRAGSKDAAILITLPPGVYTAQATGVGGTTGETLIEAFEHF